MAIQGELLHRLRVDKGIVHEQIQESKRSIKSDGQQGDILQLTQRNTRNVEEVHDHAGKGFESEEELLECYHT